MEIKFEVSEKHYEVLIQLAEKKGFNSVESLLQHQTQTDCMNRFEHPDLYDFVAKPMKNEQ